MNNIMVKHRTYPSSNGRCTIHAILWIPDVQQYPQPKAVLQIAHGMIDHIERFDALAQYMALRGILVVGNDHLGHGASVASQDDWVFFTETEKGRDAGSYVVNDMHRLTRIIKKKYPLIPYFLLGHSMGSFMARRYLMQYGQELTGALILGTGNQPKLLVEAGLLAARLTGLLKGERYRSKMMNFLLFGSYNKRIALPRTPSDWLTTDEAIVDSYCSDPKCSYLFTVNGYKGLLNTIRYVSKRKNIVRIPQALPVLIASGTQDPVGGYGQDVKRLYEQYSQVLWDVELRLYEGCRHELHSEKKRAQIFGELYEWMTEVLVED